METEKKCIQLEMNFNGNDRNQFRYHLDNGNFQVLVELPLPNANIPVEEAAAMFSDYEYLALSRPAAGLAFVNETPNTADPVSFAAKLCQTDRDRHLFYVSGRDSTLRSVYDTVKIAAGEGFKNFCPVSGQPVPGENAADAAKHLYTESIHQLIRLHQEFGDSIALGCTVNPFKYTVQDLCTQYCKLVKKLNNGAGFVAAQYGWDMRKLYEFRRYLSDSSLFVPGIARMLFLTPERAEDICAGHVPGVRISPDLEQILKREMQYSRAQFEAAQLRRIQIHTAGLRFLGYSGVQLAGIDTPARLEVLLDRIADAEREFPDYAAWRTAYSEYYEKLEMSPYPYRFYLYDNLPEDKLPEDGEQIPSCNVEIPEPGKNEMWRYRLGKLLFSHAGNVPASERKLTKKILFSCKDCSRCRLPETFYICPETCPMHRANGPCGETNPDGSCCFNPEKECIFLAQIRLATALRVPSVLEERIIPDNGNKTAYE